MSFSLKGGQTYAHAKLISVVKERAPPPISETTSSNYKQQCPATNDHHSCPPSKNQATRSKIKDATALKSLPRFISPTAGPESLQQRLQ